METNYNTEQLELNRQTETLGATEKIALPEESMPLASQQSVSSQLPVSDVSELEIQASQPEDSSCFSVGYENNTTPGSQIVSEKASGKEPL